MNVYPLINLISIQLPGPIFSVGLGSHKTVVIGDYEILKDLFKLDAVTDRPPMIQWFNQYFRYGNGKDCRGVLFRSENQMVRKYSKQSNKFDCSEGEEWKEQRRFTLRVLKDFGLGKSSMESLIQEEVEAFNDNLKQQCGTPINIRNRFNISGTLPE